MSQEYYKAGCFAGLIGTLTSHPFDTLRIRVQTSYIKSIPYHFKQLLNDGGIRSFYKGAIPPLIGLTFEKSIVFGTYSNISNYRLFKNDLYNNMFAGFTAGLVSTLIVTPVEAIKINQQNSKQKYGLIKCTYDLVKNKRLYYGFKPTLFREPPGFAIYFSTYSYLKDKYYAGNVNPFQSFILGGITGSFSWIFIYPADVVKSNMQLKNSNYNGMFDCIKTLKKENGLSVFYKGFPTCIMRAFPLHGGAFFGFELYKTYFICDTLPLD